MAKKTKKGSDPLGKTYKIIWIIVGVLTIFLTLYTFLILADVRNMIP